MISDQALRSNPFYLSDSQIEWVRSTYNGLSIRERIGQLFCLCAKDYSDKTIENVFSVMSPGGLTYRPGNCEDAYKFTEAVTKRSRVPLLLAANLEKGGNGLLSNGTAINSPLGIAASCNIENATHLGTVCAKEAASVGVNWSFAPIMDITANYRNPITNTRTFGAHPDTVAEMGAAYISSLQQNGLAACAKHFPGDGIDERDQHLHPTVNSLSADEWEQSFGMVYSRAINSGVLSIMVGHILLPSWTKKINSEIKDEEIMPASLSPELLQGLLRNHLGFNGLIVTDSSTMGGFTIPLPRSKAVPTCIMSGADMLLFTRNTIEDFNAMLDAYNTGFLTDERLEDAVTRVLALKAALKLYDGNSVHDGDYADIVGCTEHAEWAQSCAKQAITLVKNNQNVLPLNPATTRRILLYNVGSDGTETAFAYFAECLKNEGFVVSEFVPESALEGHATASSVMAENYDTIIYVLNYPTKSNQTAVRITWKSPMAADDMHYSAHIPTIAVSLNNPFHLQDLPRVKTYINAYSDDYATISQVVEKLVGKQEFIGKSPVDAFCGLWDTHL